MDKLTALKNLIDSMDEGQKLDLWREYCDANNYTDDEIYPMEEINELLDGKSPYDILYMVDGQKFSIFNEYFCFTIYGIISFNDVDCYDSPFDRDALAKWVLDGGGSHYAIDSSFLADDFVEYFNEHKTGEGNDLTREEVEELLDKAYGGYYDFLDDDWDDLVRDMLNPETEEED